MMTTTKMRRMMKTTEEFHIYPVELTNSGSNYSDAKMALRKKMMKQMRVQMVNCVCHVTAED